MSSPLPPPPPPPPGSGPAGNGPGGLGPAGYALPQPPAAERCRRHPDRDAGRRCTRCGEVACEQCLIPADIGSICVDCARRARPSTRERANLWNARQPTLVTYALIGINLAVFLWGTLRDGNHLGGRRTTTQTIELGLSQVLLDRPPDGSRVLAEWQSLQLFADFPWYRLLTSGFIHFGIIHLLFNMFLLFQLGNMLEPMLGRVRFALVYFAGLFGGSLGILLLQPAGLHGGASGAVFGLIGAAAVGLMRRGINPLSTSIGSLLMINLFITFVIPGISIGGHVGGLVGGGLAGAAAFGWSGRFGSSPPPKALSYLVPAAVIVVSIVGAVLAV